MLLIQHVEGKCCLLTLGSQGGDSLVLILPASSWYTYSASSMLLCEFRGTCKPENEELCDYCAKPKERTMVVLSQQSGLMKTDLHSKKNRIRICAEQCNYVDSLGSHQSQFYTHLHTDPTIVSGTLMWRGLFGICFVDNKRENSVYPKREAPRHQNTGSNSLHWQSAECLNPRESLGCTLETCGNLPSVKKRRMAFRAPRPLTQATQTGDHQQEETSNGEHNCSCLL